MFGRTYNPLTPGELAVVQALLSGDELDMQLLRSQVDVDLWLARRDDAPLLGILPRRKSIIVHKANGLWFAPALPEQQLGERRRMTIDDVVVRHSDGHLLRCELMIVDGYVHRVNVVGQASSVELPLQKTSIDIRSVVPSDIFYVTGPSDSSGKRLVHRHFRFREGWNHDNAALGDRWKKVFAHLESVHAPIPTDDLYEGLLDIVRLRRVVTAKPASRVEVTDLEKRLNITVSNELATLWQWSNGMSLFGSPFRGTYDTSLFDSSVLGGGFHVLLMDSVHDTDTVVVAQVTRGGDTAPDVLPVLMFSWDEQECVRTWNGVEEFLMEWSAQAFRPEPGLDD